MFDKIKQLRKLQKELNKKTYAVEKNGVKVTLNGHMEIISLEINSEESNEQISKYVKIAVNEAITNMKNDLKGSLM